VVEIAVDFDSAASENIGAFMSPEELRALIESDSEALQLASTGAADLCAARCRAIAPKVTQETRLRWNRIFDLYGSNLARAATVQSKIKAAGQKSELVAEIVESLKASSQDPCNIGSPTVRFLLTASTESGGIGLTQEEAHPLLAAAEVEPQISGADVSTAWPFGV
jgi:hypothetical protein